MVYRPDMLLQIADVINVSVDEGEVGIDLGDVRDAAGISQESVMWGIDGFISMPNLPTENKECARAMYLVDGDDKIVLATKDSRNSEKVGTLEPGDRAIISAGAQRFLMKQGNESVTLYTENQETDRSMMVTLSGEDGVVTAMNGNSFMEIKDDSITLAVNGGGYLTINKDGVQVGGKTFAANTLGGYLGIIPPGGNAGTNAIAALAGGASVAKNWLVQLT